jgi:hypothetical protein
MGFTSDSYVSGALMLLGRPRRDDGPGASGLSWSDRPAGFSPGVGRRRSVVDGRQFDGLTKNLAAGGARRDVVVSSGLSRRALLGAAGGLALATNGLLLPDWLIEEAEADNHPVRRIQHRKEEKREKHLKELERRRNQQRREKGHDGRGQGFLKDIVLTVDNILDEFVPADLWSEFNGNWRADLAGGMDANSQEKFPHGHRKYDHLAYVPFYRYLIELNNPIAGFPWVTLAWGGVMGRQGWGGGTTVVFKKGLEEFQVVGMTVEGYRFVVQRLPDDNNFKYFTLRIQLA